MLAINNIPVSATKFAEYMNNLQLNLNQNEPLAVAVSGGGDSMALAILLHQFAQKNSHKLHAITVNHGLRVAAANEAKMVEKTLTPMGIIHKTLLWEGEKPKNKIQEMARNARYELMADYCRNNNIRYLFVAHHATDQMETILFRLAKGSGVDGLSGMQNKTLIDGGELTICRPLLMVDHEQLLATCMAHNIKWVEDPSNHNQKYARVRIREIAPVLSQEGLSPTRLNTINTRINRIIDFVNQETELKYQNMLISHTTEMIIINHSVFAKQADEIKIRILKKIIGNLSTKTVRLEEIERLYPRITTLKKSSAATLGGLIFNRINEQLIIKPEHL